MPNVYQELVDYIKDLETLSPASFKLDELWPSRNHLINLHTHWWFSIPENQHVILENNEISNIDIYLATYTHKYFLLRILFSNGEELVLIKQEKDAFLEKLLTLLEQCKALTETLLVSGDGAVSHSSWSGLEYYTEELHESYANRHQVMLAQVKAQFQYLNKSNKIIFIEPSCGFAKLGALCLNAAIQEGFDAELISFDQSTENIKKAAEEELIKKFKDKITLTVGDTEKLDETLAGFKSLSQNNIIKFVIASGAINDGVLNGKAIGIRALQAMYRHKIDIIIESGATSCLFNSCHTNAGFLLEKIQTDSISITIWKKNNIKYLALKIEKNLDSKGMLDLALTADPEALLQNISTEVKPKIKIINLSLAYIKPTDCELILLQLKQFKNLRFIIIDNYATAEKIQQALKNDYADAIVLGYRLSVLQGFFSANFYEKLFNKSILDVNFIEKIIPSKSDSIISQLYNILNGIEKTAAHMHVNRYEIDLNKLEKPQLKISFPRILTAKLQEISKSKQAYHSLYKIIEGVITPQFFERSLPVADLSFHNPFTDFNLSILTGDKSFTKEKTDKNIQTKKISQLKDIKKDFETFSKYLKASYPTIDKTWDKQTLSAIDEVIKQLENNTAKSDLVVSFTSDLLKLYVEFHKQIVMANNLVIQYVLDNKLSNLEQCNALLADAKKLIPLWIEKLFPSNEKFKENVKDFFEKSIKTLIDRIKNISIQQGNPASDFFGNIAMQTRDSVAPQKAKTIVQTASTKEEQTINETYSFTG